MIRSLNYSLCLLLILCCRVQEGQSANLLLAMPERAYAQRSSSHAKQSVRKRALLVGISNYCRVRNSSCRAHDSFWWNLNTQPDIEGLAAVLRNSYEFNEIIILREEKATHQNIIDTFNELIDQTEEGDVFFFHFSGHGSQVPDDDRNGPNPVAGDELDRYDETLIPFDYVSRQDGSKDIRDDEIGQLIDRLKRKKPSSVTLTFDSCHSGTIQRGGESVIRGGKWLGAEPVASSSNSAGTDDSPTSFFSPDEARRKGFVVISAARHDQLTNETPGPRAMGAFSSALIKALHQSSKNEDVTYRDLFEIISDEVSREFREQNPQIEGAVDNRLMSDVALNRSPYLPVNLSRDGKALILRAGILMGITKASKFSLYATGTDSKTARPLATAVVDAVKPTIAILKLEGRLTPALKEKLRTARALETKHAFGDIRLRVLNWNLQRNERNLALLAALNARGLLRVQNKGRRDYHIRLCQGRCPDEVSDLPNILTGDFITLQRRAGGVVIARIPADDNQAQAISEALEAETRWRLIKELKGNDPSLQVRLRLVPVKILELNADGYVTKTQDLAQEASAGSGGRLLFQEDQTFMLEVLNLSRQAVWVTVLDLNNAGVIKPLWPHPKIPVGNSDENKIPPARMDGKGKRVWQRVPCPYVIRISAPFGPEVFKAIATSNPADFSPLFYMDTIEDIQRSGMRGGVRGTREAQTSLGEYLITLVSGDTRLTRSGEIVGLSRPDEVEIETASFTTWTLSFESQSRASSQMQSQTPDKEEPQRP